MEKLIEYYNELTNNDFNEEELKVELDSLNALKKICKWLVDNDKIDLDKRPTRNKYRLQQYKTELWWYGKIDEYSELLMLLAIQDNLIEFLVSVLK